MIYNVEPRSPYVHRHAPAHTFTCPHMSNTQRDTNTEYYFIFLLWHNEVLSPELNQTHTDLEALWIYG